MRMPELTAEASLYRTSRSYVIASQSALAPAHSVVPAQLVQHVCGPCYSENWLTSFAGRRYCVEYVCGPGPCHIVGTYSVRCLKGSAPWPLPQ
jgi:hypothetical protein